MGLGAELGKAEFGHRTHVACRFGLLEGWRLAEGHMVANASGASSAASGWPTPEVRGALILLDTRTHVVVGVRTLLSQGALHVQRRSSQMHKYF